MLGSQKPITHNWTRSKDQNHDLLLSAPSIEIF